MFLMPAKAEASIPSKTGKLPLSSQIAEILVRDIYTGVLPDGERLPAERQMAHTMGIAVGTLRKALAELEKRGLLTRVQGSGNYVHHPLDVDNVYALFRLEKADGPARPSAHLLEMEKTAKPDDSPLPGPSTHCFRFTRIRKLDDTIAALEEIWLDGRFAESLDSLEVSDALYRFYREQLNLRITRVEDRVSVAALPHWAPRIFTDRLHPQWGFVERVARDQDGLIAEFSRTWFDPVEVRFVAR